MDIIRMVKKNSALLLPIGIAIVAGLLFIPTILAGNSLKSQMQESLNIASKITSLSRNTVPADQYKIERFFQQEHAADANAISMLAQQTSQRELLVYGLFPEPTETSSVVFMDFGKVYRKAIENIIADMHAQDCPTDAEISEVIKTGGAVSQPGASVTSTILSSRNEAIIEQLCRDRAHSIPVYATANIFSGYDFWDNYNYNGRDEAIYDCWKGQLAFWIQKDIADTIMVMNKNSSSVLDSPVKRILGISFSGTSKSDTSVTQTSSSSDLPNYVKSKTEGITLPWTDRISDDDIDVVQFAFSVIVSGKAVQPFMKELCSQKLHSFKGWSGQENPQQFPHNQITILKSSLEPITKGTGSTSDKYRYGEDSVVQLSLVCEYIFYKAGYKKVKPKALSELQSTSEYRSTSKGYEP